MRCSRCRQAWFCGLSCHRSYWPVHRAVCRANDFADAAEPVDPKFARWMRKHGKLAVLRDDEVERLERADARAASGGYSRQQVMDTMYGRSDPRPEAPTWSAEEASAVEARQAAERRAARRLLPQDRAWMAIEVPDGLGKLECGGGGTAAGSAAAMAAVAAVAGGPTLQPARLRYKWRQNLSHVELFVKLHPRIDPKQVAVDLRPKSLQVTLGGGGSQQATTNTPLLLLGGELLQEVVVAAAPAAHVTSFSGSSKAGGEASTWFVLDHVLHVSLLKRWRRGRYAPGTTNADTFWRSVFVGARPEDSLPPGPPPAKYYASAYEADDYLGVSSALPPARLKGGRRPLALPGGTAAATPRGD